MYACIFCLSFYTHVSKPLSANAAHIQEMKAQQCPAFQLRTGLKGGFFLRLKKEEKQA